MKQDCIKAHGCLTINVEQFTSVQASLFPLPFHKSQKEMKGL